MIGEPVIWLTGKVQSGSAPRDPLGARGAATRDIAARLRLSTHTVRDYFKTIFRKVNAPAPAT